MELSCGPNTHLSIGVTLLGLFGVLCHIASLLMMYFLSVQEPESFKKKCVAQLRVAVDELINGQEVYGFSINFKDTRLLNTTNRSYSKSDIFHHVPLD